MFETNVNQATDALLDSADASIVFTGAPYVMYEPFKLDGNFIMYLQETLISEHLTPYQKSFELIAGIKSRVVNFQRADKQCSFFSISLVYDKSDQHRSIYNSYNADFAGTQIKSIN